MFLDNLKQMLGANHQIINTLIYDSANHTLIMTALKYFFLQEKNIIALADAYNPKTALAASHVCFSDEPKRHEQFIFNCQIVGAYLAYILITEDQSSYRTPKYHYYKDNNGFISDRTKQPENTSIFSKLKNHVANCSARLFHNQSIRSDHYDSLPESGFITASTFNTKLSDLFSKNENGEFDFGKDVILSEKLTADIGRAFKAGWKSSQGITNAPTI